jgi:dihydrofolate synthase/folylpolyglutamate synthase
MSYHETVSYLYNLQKHGIKLGLENIGRLMSALDNPHESFRSVHVAGTNGKGSTSAIIASILRTSGFRTGLFTSPHLVSFTERIRINSEEITEDDVIVLAEEVRDTVLRLDDFSPTFFEVVTAMAFLYFKREKIDIAVIETGMGGRLDATNIIVPEVSIITSISYDHREFLGNTLVEIAHEKAGIIKKGIPVVISFQEPEVIEVIEKKAGEKDAQLYIYGNDFSSVLKSEDISGICFDYRGKDSCEMHDLLLPLPGEHQMQNASVAIKALELMNERRLIPKAFGSADTHHSSLITHHCIKEGLNNVRWPGRLECINEDPSVIIDAAHNPAAANALAKSLKKYFLEKQKKIIIIIGIMADKDVKGVMEPLLPLASEIILTAPAYSRAASPENLAGVAASLGYTNIHTVPSVKDALEMAMRDRCNSTHGTQHSALTVITGSFYTIGEAREAFGQKGILTRLRE